MANIYSVAQVNSYIKNMFTMDYALKRIYIRGEVSNCKYHTSGHIYFTLKDNSTTIASVMFARQRNGLNFTLKEGQQIIALGNVNVYERDGRYQLYASEITLDGVGDLYHRFEKLRDELEEMGMFSSEYKQPIPKYAMSIGIVTASTGAAIQDMINISSRRNPYVQLYLYPALVQGEGAASSVVSGIETLDKMGMDVLIIGRGGGSIEDLWAFNEEIVARAIFNCKTPIISAVGHETDVTIADYVADLRAPTPSAAAELAVFDYSQYIAQVKEYELVFHKEISRKIKLKRYGLEQLRLRLQLYHPRHQLNQRRQMLMDIEDKLKVYLEKHLTKEKHYLALLSQKLNSLSPLEKLSKGYAFVTDSERHRIESVEQVEKGDLLEIQFIDGKIQSKIVKRERRNNREELNGKRNQKY